MNNAGKDPRRNALLRELKAMGGGSWAPLVLLLGLLLLVSVGAYFALTMNSDIPMPNSGYVAMTIGVLFSIVAGVGLMALMFFSSRRGYDKAPTLEEKDRDRGES